MEYNFLKPITSEADLSEYEKYLYHNFPLDSNEKISESKALAAKPWRYELSVPVKTEFKQGNMSQRMLNNPVFFQGYLKRSIGKLVKVESLFGERLEERTGILIDVGFDYIVLKLYESGCSLMIQLCTVKYITIAQNNSLSVI